MVNFRVPPIKGEQSCVENAYLLFKYLKVIAPKRCQRPLCWNNPTKSCLPNVNFIYLMIGKKVLNALERCFDFW